MREHTQRQGPVRMGPDNDPPEKPPGKGPPDKGPDRGGRPAGGTKESAGTDVKERVEKPRMYKVLLHNDDYTTMEFVVLVLTQVFHRSRIESTRIMLLVHNNGKGVAGVYTREVAETKATQAIDVARAAGYPLLATTEPE